MRSRVFVGLWMARREIRDLVQDVLLRLLARGRRVMRTTEFSDDAQVLAYLRQISRSRIVDHYRSLQVRGVVSQRYRARQREIECSLVREAPSPEEQYQQRGAVLKVEKALCRMARGTRFQHRNARILRRVLVEGWEPAEVARTEGLSAGTVHSLTHRCRQRLREEVRREKQAQGQ